MERRVRILVVDDDARARASLGRLLDDTAEIHEADASETALMTLRRHAGRFDVVVVECLLRERARHAPLPGLSLIAAMRAQPLPVPVIATTSTRNPEDLIIDAFRHGAADFVRKPFDGPELRAAIARATAQARRVPKSPGTHARARVARVIAMLTERTDEPLPLAALARRVGVSPSHLSRTFRTTVGMPLRAYMVHLRLERARRMLERSPSSTMTEVALEAGFYDLPHFDKVFRERFGMSPSDFAKRLAIVRSERPRDRTAAEGGSGAPRGTARHQSHSARLA